MKRWPNPKRKYFATKRSVCAHETADCAALPIYNNISALAAVVVKQRKLRPCKRCEGLR